MAEKLSMFTGGSASSLLHTIYQKYAISQDEDVINVAVAWTSHFLTSIHHYQDKLLQLARVGPELEVANMVERDIRKINSWLEELLCTAMGDFHEFIATYRSRIHVPAKINTVAFQFLIIYKQCGR